jgi:Kef-type K+ transport system membrane component KefB
MTGYSFWDFSLLLGIAAVIGFIGMRLRQPLIVSFIAVGIIVGPAALNIIETSEQLDLLAHMGIAILLFVVGLKLDIHIIKNMGMVALATGMGQVIFTSVLGYFIALLLGMDHITAIYVAVALTFSSTIIIVKLLSDKREIDTLHGKIAIGFLIVQDIVVVLVMIGLTALGDSSVSDSMGMRALGVILKGAFMLLMVALLMKYVIPHLLKHLAKSSEMLILFAIAWAVLGASVGAKLGFSQEVGAFLAGITIASTPYRDMIAARLVSLRDFLLLFFFINLGASLDMSLLGAQIFPSIVLSLFVLIGNPLIVMAIMGYMGYRKRTSLLAGFTVAQISEFSLILAALGLTLGHIQKDAVGLITLVGLITISASTYMIIYSHKIYEFLAPYLAVFERKVAYKEIILDHRDNIDKPEVIVFGLGRFGMVIARTLQSRGVRVLGVDFNPDLLRVEASTGVAVTYGDAEDPEFIAHMNLEDTKWVVSTTRDSKIGMLLLKSLRAANYKGKVAISSHSECEAIKFKESGADLILIPYYDAALEAVEKLCKD